MNEEQIQAAKDWVTNLCPNQEWKDYILEKLEK
jgi:hypothetical protein